jgi:hypothetical protein
LRRLARISGFSLLAVLAGVVLVAGIFYLRLAQGPVSLDFMRAAVENRINASLPDMSVSLGGVVIERSDETGVPHVRLRNVVLKDKQGNLVARAPRAAIGVREDALFRAALVPSSIELIGPRIRIMRRMGGGFELGFTEAAPEGEAVTIDASAPEAGDLQAPDTAPAATGLSGAALLQLLSGGADPAQGSISTIETIRVAEAQITFFDEANDAIWEIPQAELAFQRMSYGFAIAANAVILNGEEAGRWTADLAASYRRDTRSFAISARINDLVPANISDEVFALSKLARVKVPLAGHVELEVTEAGLVTKATGEFTASAGIVDLPDYLADPLVIDEGSLRADYDPVTGGIVITDSNLLVGSSRAQVKGSILPARNADGRLTALKIGLQARNVAIDTEGSNKNPVAVDRVEFTGNAAMEEARLDIDDLLIMSGSAGIRLRGAITGGTDSAGIRLSGRIRDLPAPLLKQLWPPIVTPRTRNWVNENVRDGLITEGELVVNLPVDAMARAQRQRRLPPGSFSLSFTMKDVTSGYFKDLPPLRGATGEAKLTDNDFVITLAGADIRLPSGGSGRLKSATMRTTGILEVETRANIRLDVEAGIQPLLEYLDLPALDLIRNTGLETSRLAGKVDAQVDIAFPMIKNVPKDRFRIEATGKLTEMSLKDALPGVDITEGDFGLTLGGGSIEARGPARVNGIPATLSWQRGPGPGYAQSAVIKTKLDGEQRQTLGIDLGTFARGPVGVTATIPDLADPEGRVDVAADLSEVELRIQPIGWKRPAMPKTSASFTYVSKGENAPRIADLVIKGSDLSIRGEIGLSPDRRGLRAARFTEINLSEENRFAVTIKPEEGGGLRVDVKGDSLDARPMIRGMFGARNRDEASQQQAPVSKSGGPLRLSIDLARVHANRGEILTGVSGTVSARNSLLERAEISGAFLSGQPVVFRVTPVEGGREMRINGRDGGAAIRAANLYSKVAGGQIEFYALLGNDGASVRKGKLVLRNFEVRNEAALAELDSRGKPKRAGPRRESLSFAKLSLPFTADSRFICIGESLVRGAELGASAAGLIRKSDGAIDIAGTITPAYAVNAALGDIPLVGDLLTGGRGQGLIGLTFALGGTVDKPSFQMNPMSAVAPGFLRKFFEYSSRCEPLGGAKPAGSSG